MARKGRMTRLSMLQAEAEASGELSEELEKKYLQILYKQVIPTLNDLEAEALKALATQFMLNKTKIAALLQDNTDLDLDNEKLFEEAEFLR